MFGLNEFVWVMCDWCLQIQERALDPLELELWMVVRHHAGSEK